MKKHPKIREIPYVKGVQKFNKLGFLVSMQINGHDIPIPEHEHPMVAILLPKVGSVTERFYLTPEEARERYHEAISSQELSALKDIS